MKHCNTCKYWDEDGVCDKIEPYSRFSRFDNEHKAYAESVNEGIGWLITAPDFGCWLHKKKERKEKQCPNCETPLEMYCSGWYCDCGYDVLFGGKVWFKGKQKEAEQDNYCCDCEHAIEVSNPKVLGAWICYELKSSVDLISVVASNHSCPKFKKKEPVKEKRNCMDCVSCVRRRSEFICMNGAVCSFAKAPYIHLAYGNLACEEFEKKEKTFYVDNPDLEVEVIKDQNGDTTAYLGKLK